MKTFWALYVKEWKDSRYVFGAVCVFLVALAIYGGYGTELHTRRLLSVGEKMSRALPFVLGVACCLFAPPFLLARSISLEWKSETHYLWFSLPIQRWFSLLGKFSVALSQSLVLILLTGLLVVTTISFLSEHPMGWIRFLDFLREGGIGGVMDICMIFVLPVLLYVILSLAFVIAMEGVKFLAHRYRGLMALGFFGTMVYLYARFWGTAMDALNFLGRYKPDTFWQSGSMSHGVELALYVYPFGVTVLLMAFGLWLFEKRVQI